MVTDNRKEFNIIVPTHRPEFFKRCMESILKQSILPTRIIILNDHIYDINIPNLNIPSQVEVIYFKSSELYGTGPLNAFKNMFKCIEKLNLENMEDNYFQVLEDDTEYLRDNTIKRIYKVINKHSPGLIYLKILDIYNFDLGVNEVNSVKYEKIEDNDTDFSKFLIDTSGVIFNITFKQLKEFNNYLINQNYCLNGDVYYYIYMKHFTKQNNKISILFNNFEVISNQHSNQESNNLSHQILNSGYNWYNGLPKNIRTIEKTIKHEYRFMNFYTLMVAYVLIKPILNTNQINKKEYVKDLYSIYKEPSVARYIRLFMEYDSVQPFYEILKYYTLDEIGIFKDFQTTFKYELDYLMELVKEYNAKTCKNKISR